jgi:hypothetical protein
MRTPDNYRADAERCERKARQCVTPDARDTFLATAQVWRDMADMIERERREAGGGSSSQPRPFNR